MKQKLMNALKEGHKNLGLGEEAFERVAAFGETFVTSDEQIADFVAKSLPLLKAEQSAADKVRTELNAKIKGLEGEKAELEAKLTGKGHEEDPQQGQEPADMAKIIAEAVAAAIKPISDELAGFKAEQGAKSALANAEATFKGNDYVKKYADEAAEAWERALEVYEYNKDWSAEQLNERAMGYFTKAVAKKGVDTSKPFTSDGDGGKAPDFSGELELLKSEGVELPD